jgi:hypothetical protein
MSVDRIGEIKGANKIINRLKLGRTYHLYEKMAQESSNHVNDGG